MNYALAASSYFILFFGQIIWITWLNPSPIVPTSISLLFLVAPLLLALRGVLHKRLKTFKALTLFTWLYFVYGIWNAVSATQWPLGALQIITSLALFLFSVLYVRQHSSN